MLSATGVALAGAGAVGSEVGHGGVATVIEVPFQTAAPSENFLNHQTDSSAGFGDGFHGQSPDLFSGLAGEELLGAGSSIEEHFEAAAPSSNLTKSGVQDQDHGQGLETKSPHQALVENLSGSALSPSATAAVERNSEAPLEAQIDQGSVGATISDLKKSSPASSTVTGATENVPVTVEAAANGFTVISMGTAGSSNGSPALESTGTQSVGITKKSAAGSTAQISEGVAALAEVGSMPSVNVAGINLAGALAGRQFDGSNSGVTDQIFRLA